MSFCSAERHHFSIFVEGHSRNIPVKLFQNPLTGLGGDVFSISCCQRHDSQTSFSNFGKGALEKHFSEIILKLALGLEEDVV